MNLLQRLLFWGLILGLLSSLFFGNKAKHEYVDEIRCYWDLSIKSSTIEEKSKYVDEFVTVLENSGFEGKHNVLFYPNKNNSFDYNLKCLKSLQGRLHDIQHMDINSFEYQAAIQQITAQEQGQAGNMLYVFKGIWWKHNYFLLWNWVGITQITLSLILLIVVTLYAYWDEL